MININRSSVFLSSYKTNSRKASSYEVDSHKGFTLIELMVVIAIATILVSLTAPSFTSIINEIRLERDRDLFLKSVQRVRMDAIKRGVSPTFCKSSPGNDPRRCDDDASWSDGWIAFIDESSPGNTNNGRIDSSEDVLIVQDSLSANLTIDVSGDAVDFIAFNSRGFLTGNIFEFGFCRPGFTHKRTIKLNRLGMPKFVHEKDEEQC